MRFSEDLDFAATSTVTLEEIEQLIAAQDFLEVKESFVSDFTIKINRLKYSGPLGNPNSLKVEIDCAQNVLLSGRERKYRNFYGVQTLVRVMDVREILSIFLRNLPFISRVRI